MTENSNRNRVTAEITLSHVMQLANEYGCCFSQEEAVAFLNQEGRASEIWKHMMYAGMDLIVSSLLRQYISPKLAIGSHLHHKPDF